MSKEKFLSLLSDLTEYRYTYKNVNLDILSGYAGLPASFTKLSLNIFNYIMYTKLYNEYGKAKNINEDKRTYNENDLTIEDILFDVNPGKYVDGVNGIRQDYSNMIKKIKELEENNVFYYWKYKTSYMFVMEREIGIWKFYNNGAFVPPKTIKKILILAIDMIYLRKKMEAEAKENAEVEIDEKDIIDSFGKFLNKMIGKMNPKVVENLPLWDGSKSMEEFIGQLNKNMSHLDSFEGVEVDEGIYRNLPPVLKMRLYKKSVRDTMNVEISKKLMDEIVPKNAHIARRRIGIKKTKKHMENKMVPGTHPSLEGARASVYSYKGEIDPFLNAKQFIKFYHSCLQSFSGGKAKFNPFASDINDANCILDNLKDVGRDKDKDFLTAWIRYFYDYYLKGTKIFKRKYTALKVFGDNLDEFKSKYFEQKAV